MIEELVIKNINGVEYWYDEESNNKWNRQRFKEEEIERIMNTLVNSRNNTDCMYLKDSDNNENCSFLDDSNWNKDCHFLDSSRNNEKCKYLYHSHNNKGCEFLSMSEENYFNIAKERIEKDINNGNNNIR